jgi:DNA-binding transcriptional LysR family regulator
MESRLLQTPIELRHLRYFVALGEHMHFGRAARGLHVSQPTVSRQIQELEYHLGVALVLRTPRGVVLTEAGRIMLEESRRILDKVSRLSLLISGRRKPSVH